MARMPGELTFAINCTLVGAGVAASDQEFEDGCVGFSAAVTDWAGRLAAILSVTGPSFRIRRNRFPFCRQQLLRSAHAAAAGAAPETVSHIAWHDSHLYHWP